MNDPPTASGDRDVTLAASTRGHMEGTQLVGTGGPNRDPGDPLTAPHKLGRFVVLRKLGAGGMGTVYAAYDEELDRRLAVKLLHARPGGTLGRGRLLREAQAMARLSHPNVVQIYEVGEHGPDVFVAMEFIDGSNLEAWQRERPHDTAEILAMYCQAGRGLAAAHAAGLVHRDFKPENVLVGADGRARVGDFGLARARGAAEPGLTERSALAAAVHADAWDSGASASNNVLASPLTATGALVGTPAYMSPEQFHTREVDAASDQFSFCAALYEALYGRRPFAGDSMSELVLNVTTGALLRPPADTGVPARWFEILQRGLATDPEERWPSMDALLAQLVVDPERDRSSAPRERRRLALYLITTVLVITLVSTLREDRGSEQATAPVEAVFSGALVFGMLLVATLAFRRRLWPHPFHRNVLVSSLLIWGHSLGLRLVLYFLEQPYEVIMRSDMLLHPFLAVAPGMWIAWWFYLVGAVPLVGGVVCLIVPAWTMALVPVLFPAQGLLLIYLWNRDTARQQKPA